MTEKWNRRQVLQRMAVAGTALALRGKSSAQLSSNATKPNLEIQIVPVSDHTFRLSIFSDKEKVVGTDGSLVQKDWGPVARLQTDAPARSVQVGKMTVQISPSSLTFNLTDAAGKKIQHLSVDPETGTLSFAAENSPLLGLGEGGPQFDRRGSTDRMVSGQGGYRLPTHGGRVPIPWLIGTSGWAMFIHQPFGTFDFSGPQNRFIPAPEAKWPLDIFFVGSR